MRVLNTPHTPIPEVHLLSNGRNGTAANPSAMGRTRLSGKVGAGLDPCGAMQAEFEITPGQEHEIVFTSGAAASVEESRGLIQRYRGVGPARQALEGLWHYWQRTLGAAHVETPDPGINALVNGWLLYQTLACRLWGRSGYYQSGGAFGFRDQLQDIMALVHAELRLMVPRGRVHYFINGLEDQMEMIWVYAGPMPERIVIAPGCVREPVA